MSRKNKSRGKHLGSSIDEFLKKEGIFKEAQEQAIKEVVAWERDEAMKKRKSYESKTAPRKTAE